MVWDFLNAAIALVGGTVSGLEAVLPASPLYLTSAQVSAVGAVVGYSSWFLPVAAMLATLALYIAAVVAWVGFLLLKQFIEAATP